MSSLARHETDYSVLEAEPPEILRRNLKTGSHLLASATAFFFLGFVFAYFYLRSLNNGHMWRPAHVDPSQALGVLVMLALVGSAALTWLGLRDHRGRRRGAWRLKGAAALVLALAVVVLQVVAWLTQGFGPSSGGYASVYIGWTTLFAVFVLGGAFWLETIVATSFRYRNVAAPAPGEAAGDPGRTGHDIADPLATIRPSLEAFAFFWTFLAGLGVLMWIVLYLL